MKVFDMACRTLARTPDNFGLRLFEQRQVRDLVVRALDESGRYEQRHCPLSALFVLWTVLAMTLYRHVSMANVLKKSFGLARKTGHRTPRREVNAEAFYRARYRLGSNPLQLFFQGTAAAVSPAAGFGGLRVWGVDGVRMNIPDTEENVEYFGRPTASRGTTAFPQIMAVTLVKTDTRQVKDVVVGRWDNAERKACVPLLDHLGANDLLLMDRGLSAVWLCLDCSARGAHFLGRISSSWKPRIIRRQGNGDWLVRVCGLVDFEKKGKTIRRRTTMVARMIQYTIGRNQVVRLITDLKDTHRAPAAQLARLYHERWECELAFDEIKTHLSTVTHGTLNTVFRSHFPDGILQEVYALLGTYNLIRQLIAEAGTAHRVSPLEISFVDAVEVIREALPVFQPAAPRRHRILRANLLADIAACKLRPRRKRVCPRKVKQKMSNFGLKRSGDRQQFFDAVAQFRLYDKPYRSVLDTVCQEPLLGAA